MGRCRVEMLEVDGWVCLVGIVDIDVGFCAKVVVCYGSDWIMMDYEVFLERIIFDVVVVFMLN